MHLRAIPVLLLLSTPATATADPPCLGPGVCEVIAEGQLSGAVSFGQECVPWYVRLNVAPGGTNPRELPAVFDVQIAPEDEDVPLLVGPGSPNFDSVSEALTDGVDERVFLGYSSEPGGTGTSSFGSELESVLFDVALDLEGQTIAGIRLIPTLVCTRVVADVQILPEPGAAGAGGAMLAALAALAWLRRPRGARAAGEARGVSCVGGSARRRRLEGCAPAWLEGRERFGKDRPGRSQEGTP